MPLTGQGDLTHTPGVRKEIDSRRRLVAEIADRRSSPSLTRICNIEPVTAIAAEPRGLLDLLSTLGAGLHRANLMMSQRRKRTTTDSTAPVLAESSIATQTPGVTALVEVDGPGEAIAALCSIIICLVHGQAFVARRGFAQAVATARDGVAARVADRGRVEQPAVYVLLSVFRDRAA